VAKKTHNIENVNKNDTLHDSKDFFEEDNLKIDKKLVKSIEKQDRKKQKHLKREERQAIKNREKRKKHKIKELIKYKKQEQKRLKIAQEQKIKELEKRGKISSWLRLDNAASIYPSATNKDWNFVYRISVTTKELVKPSLLQTALDDVMARFPSFNVKLKHGFFWNYYERQFNRLIIEKETTFPCQKFDLNNENSFLIRVLYDDYRISLEVFHGIADGRGALTFFNSLIARYLNLNGKKIENYVGCYSHLDLPSSEETEDSFFKHFTKEKIKREKERPAYKIKGDLMPAGMFNSVEGEMSVFKVKEVAKKYGVGLSVFLASVIGYCIYKRSKNSKKPTRISIPFDLRTRFESETLRNFSSYVNVEVKGQNLTFEDIIEIFKTELNKVDTRMLQANINTNVGMQKNIFIKLIPLCVKNVILKTCFNYLGENYQTLAFSNIGQVVVPKEFDDFIDGYSVNLGRSKHNAKSIGVISYKDKLSLCISSKIYETETERDIFKMLTKLSIPVKVYSNRRDLYGTR